MMRKNGPDNEQSLILLPPAPDTISQQEIAHPSDISNHFLAEELVFYKKNSALRPSLLGPCRLRVKRGAFKHGPNPLPSIFLERTRSALK
jgi:hypothetical protein